MQLWGQARLRALTGAGVLVASAGLVTLATTPAHAVAEGSTGGVLYAARVGSASQIFAANADGTNARQLTSGSVTDFAPVSSPDGLHIAYVSLGVSGAPDIVTSSIDGSGLTQLTHDGHSNYPAYSPDGRHLAYVHQLASGEAEVWVMDTDGTHAHRVVDGANGSSPVDYSPDGTRIAFATDAGYVSTVDVDGSDLTTVTYGYAPSWSPDGLRLAFSTYDFPAAVGVVDADGSDRQVVVSAPGVEYRRPHWSPDGTRLVVTPGTDTTSYVETVAADGSGPTAVTDPAGVSADGAWLYATHYCQGQAANISGTAGDDVLTGTPGDDVIWAGDGNDTIDGGGGADVICGGSGTDTVTYASHQAPVTADLYGGAADDGSVEDGPVGARDTIGADVENLVGGPNDDTLSGNSGANVLTGGPGDDVLRGLTGNDTLNGGSGDDVLAGGDGNDLVYAGSGDDRVRAGDGNDTAYGQSGDDWLSGGDQADYLAGGTGDDTVAGGEGGDSLEGGPDADSVKGGPGADRLSGSGGRDSLDAQAAAADVSIDCGADADTVSYDAGQDPAPVSC